MAQFALYLLGQFRATIDGAAITTFQTDKVRALLAYLAVENSRDHRRDTLASLLWPEGSDEAARANLRQSLCRLRNALEEQVQVSPWLMATSETVRFDGAGDCWVDAVEFSRLLETCEKHRHRNLTTCRPCAERLAQAVALYRGEFLAGLCVKDCPAFAEWSLICQQTFHRKMTGTLQHLAAHHMLHGETAEAEFYLQRQVALEPWDETVHQQLMRLYAASGRRGNAVAQYLSCRHAVGEQFGVAPGSETNSLFESIRAGQPFALPANQLVNAPAQTSALIGRSEELAHISATLQNPDCRLLTLVGLGGCGKTRLAVEIAVREAGAFLDGACFCSLAAVSAAHSPALTLAQALGLTYSGAEDAQTKVRRFLGHKEILLVLDNLEHLPAGRWVAQLLRDAPGIVILATSRQKLDIQDEWRIQLHGLTYLEAGSSATWPEVMQTPAVQLFVRRAAQTRPGFTLTEEIAAEVVRICRQVDGLPLALELAASWVDIMSCAEIASAIDASLDFLTTAWCDIPDRQRSLRATLDYGWSLLSEEEQNAFACLSVFRGEFSHSASRAVVGNPCTFHCRRDTHGERPVPSAGCLFRAFVEKAVLQEAAPGRYRLHSLLRHYAEEKLMQSKHDQAAARLRFVSHFAGLVDRAARAWDESEEETWRNRVRLERHNIETALEWVLASVESYPDVAPRLARALILCRPNS